MIDALPYFVTAEDAVAFYRDNPTCSDAIKAYILAFLTAEGFSNRAIRAALQIPKVYTVTHLKRAGQALDHAQLTLWHRNPTRITLGHVRAIASFPSAQRETWLRKLLVQKIPVHQLEALAQGRTDSHNADIKRYQERMAQVLGRPLNIRYNPATQSGSLTLDFFTLEDLDRVAAALGFTPEDDY